MESQIESKREAKKKRNQTTSLVYDQIHNTHYQICHYYTTISPEAAKMPANLQGLYFVQAGAFEVPVFVIQ